LTYIISKEFHLSYSHQLFGLRDGHPCGRVHGHNAIVKITLERAVLDETGFVLDYGDLTPLGTYLNDTFDHRHLNDVFTWQPSAENLAHWLYDWCASLGWPVSEVAWSETPKTWATYRP